jgi:hypothetical protein
MAAPAALELDGQRYRTLNEFARHLNARFGVNVETVLAWARHFGAATAAREARRYFVRHYRKPEPRQPVP